MEIVHTLPPKSFIVRHKGLHGTITYNRETKKWDWKVNLRIPMNQSGTEPNEERARQIVKKVLESASVGAKVTSVD